MDPGILPRRPKGFEDLRMKERLKLSNQSYSPYGAEFNASEKIIHYKSKDLPVRYCCNPHIFKI